MSAKTVMVRGREYYRSASEIAKRQQTCKHKWSNWKDVGRTGDWFKPIIVERRCETCGASQNEDR